jgi:hypothetical protein
MSADGEMKKSLAKWLTKAKAMPAPPAPTERRRSVADVGSVRSHEPTRQLNLKVADSTYRRIKGLAYRDRLSLVAMLDEMLELYEGARGKLEK